MNIIIDKIQYIVHADKIPIFENQESQWNIQEEGKRGIFEVWSFWFNFENIIRCR